MSDGGKARHLVDVSGGAASAVAAFRVLERYGTDGVVVRFADVGSEDADVYRFLDDVERVLGIPIVRLNQGVDTWQLFEKRGMWFSPRGGCVASYHLKRLPLEEHAESVGDASLTTIHVGFDITEQDRMDRLRKAGAPWQFDFPLAWPTPMLHCDVLDFLKSNGIRPPSAYEQGFTHANCGGACVLAGIGQWQLLLKRNPELYAKAEAHEQRMLLAMREAGRKETAILEEQANKVRTPLPLSKLREDTESGRRYDAVDGMKACGCATSWLFEGDVK